MINLLVQPAHTWFGLFGVAVQLLSTAEVFDNYLEPNVTSIKVAKFDKNTCRWKGELYVNTKITVLVGFLRYLPNEERLQRLDQYIPCTDGDFGQTC